MEFDKFLILKIGKEYRLHKASEFGSGFGAFIEYETKCGHSFEYGPGCHLQRALAAQAQTPDNNCRRVDYIVLDRSFPKRDQYTAVCPICFPNGVENE